MHQKIIESTTKIIDMLQDCLIELEALKLEIEIEKEVQTTLNKCIEDMDFSVRTYNTLKKYYHTKEKDIRHINTIELSKISEAELWKIKGCGINTITEIMEVMKELNLTMLP